MTIAHSLSFGSLRQRVRRWIAIPATALALTSGLLPTDSSNVVRADELVQPRATRPGVEAGGTGANQRSIPNGAYETMPTRRYRRGGSGRYYNSRPRSSYYRAPGYYGNYGGPRAYYAPRGGYYGYGGGYGYPGGYPGFYGRGYGGYYGSGGAVGIGPLTFWW